MFAGEANEIREALLKRAAHVFRVPDEMTNAERGEVLARIPRGQARDGTGAFVLPDFAADAHGVGARERDRLRRPREHQHGETKDGDTHHSSRLARLS